MDSRIDLRAPSPNRALAREWIIFAVCLGLGGHVALGVVLHAPELWSLREAGLNGLLSGLGLYTVFQAGRWLWWSLKARPKA